MEINIQALFDADCNPANYSASVAELGPDAAARTWSNAMQRAAYGSPLLDTPEKLAAMRKWAIETGAWPAKAVDGWGATECNALFLQLVAGDMREKAGLDWAEYRAASGEGSVSGALFEGIDGQIYYYLGD